MELLIALFFGIVQGATEFLPISGGGHLAMIQNFNQTIFGETLFSPTLTFDILLRLGTLLAIVFVFFSEIKALMKALWESVKEIFCGKFSLKTEDETRKLLYMLTVTTLFLIPAYFLTAYTESYLSGLQVITVTLMVTGISNLLIDKVGVHKSTNAFFEQNCGKDDFAIEDTVSTKEPELQETNQATETPSSAEIKEISPMETESTVSLEETSESMTVIAEEPTETQESKTAEKIPEENPEPKTEKFQILHIKKEHSLRKAIIVGFFQLCSVIPGLSRSSAVILGSLVAGFRRDFAVKYAFLAAIPVLLAKIVLQLFTVLQDGIQINWLPYLVGTVAAFVSGVFSIGLMRKTVRKYYCKRFGWYCFILGIIIFVIQTRG